MSVDWWTGVADGTSNRGSFPASYVERLGPPPPESTIQQADATAAEGMDTLRRLLASLEIVSRERTCHCRFCCMCLAFLGVG